MTSALTETLERRAGARTKLTGAAHALDRARTAAATAQADVDRLAEQERAWTTRHQVRIERWIASGSVGNPPVLVADAKVQQQKASADANSRAAKAALVSFDQQHTGALADLAAAERAVERAAIAQLTTEAEATAARISELYAEADRLRHELRGLDAVELHTPIDQLGGRVGLSACLTSKIRAAMLPPSEHTLRIHTPVNQLRQGGAALHSVGLAEQAKAWRARYTTLVSGESIESPAAAAEAAA